jgi:mannose/fructose/N-acetylgalactosamine-specific phosphotransferase system component IIC
VLLGALLELLLIIANIGTAVVLHPVVKRQNEILALGYVTARLVECAFIAVGILSLLTVVTLRQEATAGADTASLVAVGEILRGANP